MAELSSAIVSMFDQSLETGMQEITTSSDWTFSTTEQTSDEQLPEAVFLTMSSHLFRVFVAINFERSRAAELVALGLGVKNESLEQQMMDDYLLELGNSVCGIFKRELGKHIPALGMSTPNLLRRESFTYMDSFHVTSHHFRWVNYRNQSLFLAGYYYCPYSKEEIEINLHPVTASSDVGELELF